MSFNHCNSVHIILLFLKLVILKAHNHECHSNVESTLNQLRAKYLTVKGRQNVKTIFKTCVICCLCQGKPCLLLSSRTLPNSCVSFNHQFEVIGIDYVGPLFIRDSYSNK